MATYLNGNVNLSAINSGDLELNSKIIEWIEWDKNKTTNKEICDLVVQKNWNELKERLLTRLEFGTAGLRGRMRAGYNGMNDLVIVQTAQGLLEYILKCYPNEEDQQRGIVIAYDGRYNSKRFAEISACIFITKNVPVYLFSTTAPTPFVPFTVKHKQCLLGIMVTASHNPKEDNGYKVYWTNSAQIISPHEKNIQKSIVNNSVPLSSSWQLDLLKTSSLIIDPYQEIFDLYLKRLVPNIPKTYLELNAKSDMKFVYTAMHGVGYPYVAKSIEAAKLQEIFPVKEQQEPDPEFSTVKFPNPEEGKSCLELSIKLANKIEASVILANDPDADRLACAERNEHGEWKIFTGNELGTLLGWWAFKCYQENHPDGDLSQCYMLASTVSSKILQSIARIEGFHFEETLTGFKWMGNRAIELIELCHKPVLFAFEEAIGYMFTSEVLDKDGVSAAAHLATLANYLHAVEQKTLLKKLEDLYVTYGYHFSVNSYFLCYDQELIVRMFERIRNWNNTEGYPDSILDGKYKIKAIRDLTNGKDTSQPNGKAVLPVSKSSQMITFTFENGVVVTLRTSGTEPKIKYYTEMCAQPGNKDYAGLRNILNEMIDGIIDEFLQPKLNNIIARSE